MLVNERYSHLYSKEKVRGLIRIRNMVSNAILLVPSEDLVVDIQRIRFSLDLGTYDNAVLQQEYETIGLELFAIDAYYRATSEENLAELLGEHKNRLQAQSVRFY